MLLHVVTAAFLIDHAADARAFRGSFFCFEIVDNPAVVGVLNLGHAHTAASPIFDPASIENLASTGWIERCSIEYNTMSSVDGRGGHDVDNLAFEFVQKRVVIIKTIGHKS